MILGRARIRVAHWLWWSRDPVARVARGLLLPVALLYRGVMAARSAAYRRGWLRARRLPLPSVAVGNLAVGGAGKTPFAAWVAAFYARRGERPGVLLRGYGGDEHRVHERLVPGAIVVPDPDRLRGAERARAAGAQVLVLDDAYQRLNVARDLNVALFNTETARAAPWPLPAGPWREALGALARADLIVVTRRRASRDEAGRLAQRLAARWPAIPVAAVHLAVDRLEGMRSGRRAKLAELAGKRVVVAAGIADPASFAVQVRASGAIVQLVAYQDHHAYSPGDVARLVRAAATADYVVVTEKDAVKLRDQWPADAVEPLVAVLQLQWELNGDAVERALEGILRRPL
ncbi:MAG TPA: tetraacyldisaccharide 4'-kinase [Gemmatimonadales bacterium]|jgi:tetraacyldisaccharide 4'-kinase|nr:tetraacyldisaccharide 4'-kinase [Gemmatimonadales bacterium]